jgi:hypothetical protein
MIFMPEGLTAGSVNLVRRLRGRFAEQREVHSGLVDQETGTFVSS